VVDEVAAAFSWLLTLAALTAPAEAQWKAAPRHFVPLEA